MESVAASGSQSLCNNDDVLIRLSGVGQGRAPVSGSVRVWLGGIGYSLNRTFQANGFQVGDTLYYAAAGTVPAGEYTVEVLSATDANGCSIDTSGSIYQFNYVVNETSATTLNEVICSPNSFAVGAQSFNSSGTYTVTLTNQDGCDSVVTLNLLVHPAVQISVQPSAVLTVSEGNVGTLSVVASNATSFQWQTDLGGVWTNLSNDSVYSGVATSALSFLANLSLNGLRFRVIVSGNTGCIADTSASSVLTVTPVAAIRLALNNPADVVAGGTRASYRVTRMNSLGNPTGGSSLIVSITSIPSQGLFYDALNGGQLISQVVIPQDSVGADFWFTSLVADEYRIQASSTGLTPAEDTIVVNAGAAKGIRIVAQDTAVVGDSVLLTGIIIDSLGNQTVLTNNIR
ncbi:MAG: hypothetical protein ACKOHH_04865, partial [Bacteroidota bacterium]